MKVMTIVGTRPEIIKLSEVIRLLDESFIHIFVHTGQNYDFELNQQFFQDLEIRNPDHFLECAADSPALTISNVIASVDELLALEKPDAMLVYGDTNSCLAVLPAKRRKIPIFHMEAGNRCFDLRVPEEINRKLVDHLSDINLVLTEQARNYLIAEGVQSQYIFKVGSCLPEIIRKYDKKIKESLILQSLGLTANGYFVASVHREENVDSKESLLKIIQAFSYLAEEHKKKVVVSTHPRTFRRLREFDIMIPAGLSLLKPMGFFDYLKLQTNSYCVLSDSGTITEEASILGFPSVMIRDTHERPEGMDNGVSILTGVDSSRICESVQLAIRLRNRDTRRDEMVSTYGADDVSVKVAKIIQSYTPHINKYVWRKSETYP